MRSARVLDRLDVAARGFRTAHQELLAAVAEMDRDESWRLDGSASLAAWLSGRYQVSFPTAREWVRDARALSVRPDTADAFGSGELSHDQVVAISKITHEDPTAEGVWAENLSDWPIDALQREARKATARRLEGEDDGRYLRVEPTSCERFMKVDGRLVWEEGVVVIKALERGLPTNTSVADYDAAMADSLVALARVKVASDADPDRATVVLHLSKGDDVAELENGFVGRATAERLSCDARVETVTHAPDGTAVGIGRASRVIPAPVMRELRRRDRTCCHPDCTREMFLHGHHRKAWSDGGRTDLDNLFLVCVGHHKLLHEGRWSVRGPSGPRMRWVRPDGSVYRPRMEARARGPTS